MPLLTRKLTHARRMELMPTGSLPMARIQHARPLRIALVTEYYYPHLGGVCEHVHFFARDGVYRALNGVNLELQRGEMLGLVGETGSGKSLTLRTILNLVPPPGRVVGALRGVPCCR